MVMRSIRIHLCPPTQGISASLTYTGYQVLAMKMRAIQTTLRAVDLDSQLDYSALSYLWGSAATGSHLIECGGDFLSVTENCYLALKNLRKKARAFHGLD